MSIIPRDKNIVWQWEVAALDIPVPEKMMLSGDAAEWGGYINAMPIDRALQKLAESVDQYLAVAAKSTDFLAEDITTQELIFSKWTAASTAAHILAGKLGHPVPDSETKKVGCMIGYGLYFVVGGLQRLKSADLPAWEARHDAYKANDTADRKNLSSLISSMWPRIAQNDQELKDERDRARKAPRPPQP